MSASGVDPSIKVPWFKGIKFIAVLQESKKEDNLPLQPSSQILL